MSFVDGKKYRYEKGDWAKYIQPITNKLCQEYGLSIIDVDDGSKEIGVSWEHGIYLGSTLSTTNFKAYKREYGTPEKIEDIYDYRAKLKQKFYFYQDMSKDDDVPKKLQNDFLHQMYEDFGTIEEDCFYDRLEDGKYDEGFKERQVKEEKCR